MKSIDFRTRAHDAIHNSNLQKAIAAATTRFATLRGNVFGELGAEGERLRDAGKAIRVRTLANLDQHLARAAEQIERAGGVVHWAADAEEARRIIIELAQARGVKHIVKSKSMVSEEIEANHAFEHEGMQPVETDLGEWLVQLAGERPSHLIAPVIHKTKAEIASLLSRVVGREIDPDIPAMVNLARGELREKFLGAQIGMSGANFVVAETGTIVIVENEGNARLATSLPPIHVALTGIEKVVPTWDDLAVLLALLPRSGTGQKMTSYVSLITGPRRANDADGPKELHLIFLDNGRTKLLAGELREALQCIRCGACLNACPVYGHIGGHAYGWTYAGPIGAILTPAYGGIHEFHDLPHASSLCGACRDICPVRIDIPRMLVELRQREVNERVPSIIEHAIFKLVGWSMRSALLFRVATKLAYWAQRPFVRQGRVASMPFLGMWTDARDFPMLASETFHEWWKSLSQQ